MLISVIALLRGSVIAILLALNLLFWGTLFFFVAIPKLFVLPFPRPRRGVVIALARVGDFWSGCNRAIFRALLPTVWDFEVPGGLRRDAHYLIMSNHQSWADIFVVQHALHRQVSFIRFFLKQELIWFPIVGQASWALEFPFMKRYTPEYLAKHPEKRGADIRTTRRACERYASLPVAILNFIEGTRFTREKREEQASPYRHLLRPRIGGISYVLASLGQQLDETLDVTIAYDTTDVSIWRLVKGEIPRVIVRAREVDVPEEFLDDAITEPGEKRDAFARWLDQLWREKDALLEELKTSFRARA